MNNRGTHPYPAVLEVARALAHWRQYREMSVERLAHLSGVDCELLRAIEAGQVDPDLDMLDRLATSLRVRPVDLCRITDKKS